MKLLSELLKDSTAGDPMGGLRWTHKTLRNLAAALRRRGMHIGRGTVARLLREQKYSLRTNRKRLAKTKDPHRNRQFQVLARRRRHF
jgi:Rhodopirellula transposase DDE domain